MILVTGTPRSGTKYASDVLVSRGARLSHEQLYPDGMVSPFAAVEDVELRYLDRMGEWRTSSHADYAAVYHQTRHPLKTIRSLMSWSWLPGQMALFERHTRARSRKHHGVVFWALFWCDWNRIAECVAADHGGFSFQVENLPVDRLLNSIGIEPHEAVRPLRPVPTNVNACNALGPAVSVDEIAHMGGRALASEVVAMAGRYGYAL